MGLIQDMEKKKYLVDDDILDRVFIIPNNELYNATPHNHNRFERMLDAQKYRIEQLYYHYKVRSNDALASEWFCRLQNIEEEHPEWLI